MFPFDLKGHGFSRAVESSQEEGASAPEGAIVVSGSVYLVGEARELLLKEAQPQ